MTLKFRAIKNRLCRARNENIRNIGKNNGLFNADGKGDCLKLTPRGAAKHLISSPRKAPPLSHHQDKQQCEYHPASSRQREA